MDWSETKSCPDCQGELQNINIIDATDRGMGGGVGHVEMAYAVPSSTASNLTRTIPKEGIVKGKICKDCSRIFLYGSGGFKSLREE